MLVFVICFSSVLFRKRDLSKVLAFKFLLITLVTVGSVLWSIGYIEVHQFVSLVTILYCGGGVL
jgi:hypothetical protein